MKTYTIHVQSRDTSDRVALRRKAQTKEDAMEAAERFSNVVPLCDVVVTIGSKHVVTYRDCQITHLNGKEYKA